MAAAIPLRGDFDATTLRMLARRTLDAYQGRRLLALAEIYEGGSRGKAARIVQHRLRLLPPTSSITAASLGTVSSRSLGGSPPLGCAIGLLGFDQ